MLARPYPQHAYNTCFGILGFSNEFGAKNLEQTCNTALNINDITSRRIKLILEIDSK